MERWQRDELIVAFYLYCTTPFGKIHRNNPTIIEFSHKLGRTPSSLAMKMCNFASLDPEIIASGRKGLGNASINDRQIWDEFHDNWESLAILFESMQQKIDGVKEEGIDDFYGRSVNVKSKARLEQSFFRTTILGNYQNKCCMTGLNDPRLLIASHIVPWNENPNNRLNPRNGLCLSALHHAAFDWGLITVSPNLKIMVSTSLNKNPKNVFHKYALESLQNKRIMPPEKFFPNPDFLKFHNDEVFLK